MESEGKETLETSSPTTALPVVELSIEQKLDILLKGQVEAYKRLEVTENQVKDILDKWSSLSDAIDTKINRRFEGAQQLQSEYLTPQQTQSAAPAKKGIIEQGLEFFKTGPDGKSPISGLKEIAQELGIVSKPQGEESLFIVPVDIRDLEKTWIKQQWTDFRKAMQAQLRIPQHANMEDLSHAVN